VRVVEQQPRVVAFAQSQQLGHRREIAVHAEHPVGHHQDQPIGQARARAPALLGVGQDLAQGGDVGVGIDLARRL